MKTIQVICGLELKRFFSSPIAYIFCISFWMFMGWYFFRGFFLIGQANMRLLFDVAPWILLFFIPAISMRTFAEEKKAGTLDFLLTLPIKDYEIVIGKFLASFILMSISILGTFPIVIMVTLLGNPDLGPIFTGYIGVLLLGAAFLAIGHFISSLTKNQIIAFILSILACFTAYIMAKGLQIYVGGGFFSSFLTAISLSPHYESISKGIIDLRDILYYASFIVFFLFLNIQALESRRINR